MTAPDARTLAEIVAEGRRLEAERSASSGDYAGQVAIEGALIDFLLDNYGSLLAVAEAAAEWEAAEDAYDHSFDPTPDLVIGRVNASLALRAAVRGEEKTK